MEHSEQTQDEPRGEPGNGRNGGRSGPIRVMLVDDQHLLRMGFRLILEGEDDLDVVAEAADGADALETIAGLGSSRPDVVLMDVQMPRMDGIEATRRIVERHPETRVIILTTFDLDEYAFSGLQAGASAFLLKDVGPEDLVSAVRVVDEGDAVVAPRITQRLLEMYVRTGEPLPPIVGGGPGGEAPGPERADKGASSAGEAARTMSPGPRGPDRSGVRDPGRSGDSAAASAGVGAAEPGSVGSGTAGQPSDASTAFDGEQIAAALQDGVVREPLTQREAEVLFAVAEGLSNAEIAARFFLSEATVKTHVRRILTKLQLRDRVQAVVYAYQAGLVG